MVVSFQQRLFGAILSDPQLIKSLNPSFEATESLLAALDLSSSPDLSINRFESAFRAATVMPFLMDWDSITVAGRESKMNQLNALAKSIAEFGSISIDFSANEDSDWKLTVNTFVHVR